MSEKLPKLPDEEKKDEDLLNDEDLLSILNVSKDASLLPVQDIKFNRDMKAAESEAIWNVFSKEPQKSEESIKYLEEKKDKLNEKLKDETDEDKKKNVESMLKELTDIMNKLSKNIPDKKSEVLPEKINELPSLKNSGISSFLTTNEAKDVLNNFPKKLPDIKNPSNLNSFELPDIPVKEFVDTNKENVPARSDKQNPEDIINKANEEREKQKKFDVELREKISKLKPIEIKTGNLVPEKDLFGKKKEITRDQMEEAYFKEAKNLKISLKDSIRSYLIGGACILENTEKIINLVGVKLEKIGLVGTKIKSSDIFERAKFLGLSPCTNDTVLDLSPKMKDLFSNGGEFFMFIENHKVLALSCDKNGKNMSLRLVESKDFPDDSRWFFDRK
jgi:hypothetical protein